MKKKYVVAFDQGTTSTRTIIFDQKGEIVNISQKELIQHYPQSGWVEHNAEDIYKDQVETFHKVLEDSKIKPEEIVSIGITNQRETTVVSVSYTHLRAHETSLHLVCRLLLEKILLS